MNKLGEHYTVFTQLMDMALILHVSRFVAIEVLLFVS